MNNILKVKNVKDYSDWVGAESLHPLIAVIDYSAVSPLRHSLNSYSVYGMFFQDNNNLELTYGCGKYDYKDGSLICVAPGQIGGKEDNGSYVSIGGWALLFHPDLLNGKYLAKEIRNCTFFNYSVNEGLYMSREEYNLMVSILRQLQAELRNPSDEEQDAIIVSYLSVLLMYSQRFYSRQFLTRKVEYSDLLARFTDFLGDYYDCGRQHKDGIPTVQTCADALHMSTNYFSDIIKRLTGDNASHHIRNFIIRRAKESIIAGMNISQVAYDLGFEYPQHFTRMFKKHSGITPTRYLESLKGNRQ